MATETPQPFERVLDALQLDSKTLNQPIDATFIPERSERRDPSLDSLPVLSIDDGDGAAPELSLQQVLGEGGRGEIRLGSQLSLRRQVAVKSLKGEAGPAQTMELLREARITGGLEHPNVVPVYALGRDASGRVLLVMKQVKGEPWGKLMRADSPPRSDAELERHLEIFLQVCNAVEFAHSQGIVHRDLKPDNVMVGAFGEVVVLDWGLAVSLEGDPARALPKASDVRGLAGTPAYMAPELVSGEGARVGRWTDVYLLGAILHELVTGAPPHHAPSLPEALEHAYASARASYPRTVPEELAGICHRAMDPDPSARFANVAELRAAVQAFARHRQSAQLAAEARALLDSVSQAPRLTGIGLGEGGAAAHAALAQSRFGFEQALRTWPENPVARAGLRQTRERQIELELALGNLAGAERALAELEAPSPALVEQVEALRRKRLDEEAELERLRALQRDIDPDSSARVRNMLLASCGLMWCVLPVGFGLYERAHHIQFGGLFMAESWIVFAVASAVGIWIGKRELLSNRMGRMTAKSIAVFVIASALVRLCVVLSGRPIHEGIAYEMILYAVSGAFAAIFIDARFLAAVGVFGVAGPIASWHPEWSFFVAGTANFFALIPIAIFWRRLSSLNCEVPLLDPSNGEGAQPATRRAQSA